MKKFKFRLQTVLEYREKLCEERKGELLKANQALAEAENELLRLEALLLENTLEIQEVAPVSKVVLNAQISQGLMLRVEQSKTLIEIRKQEVEAALEQYKEASKELKAVSTLKERKLQEYNKHVADLETATLDELATQRAARNMIMEGQGEH